MKIGLFLICLTSLYNQATCSQFNENLLISTSYPLEIRAFENLYETIQLEIWSFYVTNWNVISYPYIDQQPFQQISKTQLIFLMKNIEDGEILGLLYNDVITYESVLHCIQVNDMMMKVQQITSAYEGSWIVNVITIAGNIIQYETFGASQQLQQQQKQQFELKKYVRKILCFVGGSTIINKEVYGVFKGRLSKLMVNSYQLKNIVAFYYERIQQLRAYEQEYTISLIPDLVNFDGVIQKEFSFEQFGRKFSIHGWVKYYTYDAYYLKKYLLVRLTTFKNYQDEIDLGDEILKITVDLDLINTEKCGYDLISHHYWMPYPQQISGEAQQDKISLREDLPYLEILSKWHFISFEHGLNNYYQSQFILGYYDDQELRYKTYYLGDAKYNRLFINTKYYAIFGGDYTVFEKMKGQLSGFYFKSNYGYDLNLQINCHYSCQTCNGPLFSNCLTCQNERVFLDESHQCVCPLGQFEKDKQCKTYSDLFSTVDYIETKLVQSNYQCPFGYFNLPTSISSQCIKCPQWNSYNLLCVDCILNSTNWYKKPICTTDFVTQQITQDKDAYRQQQRSVLEYDLYYIDNNYNLILLEGVYDFCDITKIYTDNCIDLGIQHLQTSQFGFCKQNRFYFNFGCYLLDTACVKINKDEKKCLECLSGYYISEDSKSCLLCPQSCINCQSLTICQSCESGFGLINQQCQRCGKFCKTCQYSSSFGILQCLSCIDNHKYYLSLNAQDCKINEIDNCIYAFETSESDVTINSLDYNFQPYYQKTVTKCAKCEDGYYFHDSDLICVQGYWKDCQQYFVRIQGIYVNYICLFGPYSSALIYSFSDQCPRLKLHCIHCVIEQLTTHLVDDFQVPKKASYTCLVCQNGYYADKRTGQCQLCPTDLNCLTCIQQNRFTKDHWKIHIRAFYRAAIDLQYLDHKFTNYGLSQVESDYEILCTICQQGYELYEDKCIKICPESCLECKVEDYQNICVKCPLGLRGRNRSLIDNQCIECPYNCQLCQQRTEEDIFAVNPLFNNSEFSYFSYFCISGFKGYLDQELGLYVDCQYEACQQQIIINLNLLCNPEEYQRQFDLLYDENQKIKFKQENILGDHLFSSSSFPEFETQEFYQMANQKSIKQILIKITSQQKQTCLVNDQLQISQKFSSNIFSTIDVQLEIFGQGITTFYFQKQLLFLNFKRVYIQGIQLQIEYFIFGPNLLKFASPFEQTIELVDITYSQEFEQTTFYIIMQNSKNVLIQDFLLINYTKQFTIDAFIKIEQIQSLQKIKIHNFSVFSSSFLDTHLFWFDLKEQDKVDMQLIYIEKTFFNQSLIYQTKGQLQIQYIKVQSCQIQSQSALFQINSLKHFELNFLDFISNIIESGNILKLNQNTNLLNLNITKNQFYKKSQFIYNENIEIQYLFIQNIVFQLNIHNEYVTFLKLTSTLVPNKEIIIDQFSIIGNKFQQIDDQAILDHLNITLIYMEVQIITIDQLIIEKSFGLPVFVISNANQLQLNQITIQQHDNYKIKGLYQNYDCFQNSIKNITDQVSIKIYNVPIIELKQITISKAQSINNPIIEIKTSILNTQTKKQILLSEMNFNQNLLLTTNKINLASLFKISSEEDYQIDIKNSNFERNVMHQYTYIDQINSGLVFFIDCNQCTLFFQSLIFQRNIVTNSSNSIILIQTKSLEIIDCSFNENSQFDYLILQPYLFWGYQENQEIFMEQLESNFPIVVKTGNGRIQSQHLMIKNITISNSTGSAFYIYLEKEASLNIQNAIISYINALFLNEDEDGGSFMIDTSITVSAQMNFNNISINDIYFRNKGGFIYIQNVLETTTIQLSNIFSNDVYSLKGSILYVEFAFYSKQQQQLTLDNIKTIDTQQGFLRFLSKFTKINSQILSELKFKRSLFQISYAQQIRITNLLILSLLHQSLAIISESKIILIQNCKVSNSNIQNSLLSFSQMQTDSKISLIDFQVTNTSMLQHIPTTNYCIIDSSNFEIQQQNCEKEYIFKEAPIQLIQKYIHDDISNSYCIINQMNQLQTQSVSSLIDINPQATQSQISRLTLREINCKICKYGLFNVNFENNYSIVIMNQITIQDNQCGQQSCLNFIKFISNSRVLQSLEQNIQEKTFELKLHNFKCIGNLAYKGTCLQIQNLKTLIENSILQNNTAESFGGSIYVIGKESFFVLNTVIQFNQAQFGGGLFLKDQIIQNLNKQGTSVNDNIGISFGKDLAQLPSQLSISTDLQNLLPKIKIQENDNILIEQIQIEKYQTVLNTYSDVLYVPNGQILSNYQFFDLKKQQYFPYNIHLRLIPLDLQNNIQKNLDNTQCKVSGRILTQNEDEQFNNDYTSFNSITFNQSDYNFDQLIFYLDDQLNQTLQLQFHCNSIFTPIYGKNKEIIGYHNNYYLRMNIKSLPCQLGEIKSLYDATCQPCDTTLGLYSLNLNSHNCSQKDDISTSEIKSAQLRLRPGFWRPYYNTDFISQCINLLSNCNGGWIEGDTSCFEGHIGALCEECDIQNSQGYGHFSISSKYSCGLCVQNNQNIAALTFISLWTLISILISVRSNVTLNDQILLKKVISKLFLTNIQYHSNFGILIKITTHHLQIVSFVFTFRITNIIGVGKVINSISNPIQTITHSLDCVLKDMFDIEIHYSRIIWHLIMPFIYIVLFLILYWIALKINRLQYSSTVIITTLIFMYIYLQPFLVGGLISLMSYRQISGFNWIQANVAFRYDTPPHQKWLYSFCLPLLILITSIIPFIFFICLYLNKTTLHKKITRQKLGYLYNEYKLEAYYWEIIKILFKELMIIFLSYYDENVVKKGILLLSLVYIYWELSKIFKPYVSFILNKLDAYSANVCGISIALGIGIYIDQENQSYEIQILYLLILFTLNLQYLIKILKEILFSFADENFLFLDKIKSIIKNKIPSILKYQIFQKLLQNRNAQKQRIDQRYLKLRKYLIGQAKIIIQCKKNYGIKITSNSFNKSSLNL